MTSYIIPCLLAFVTLFALGQKIDVYNALVRGAENGLNVTFRIVPSLVALLTGVSMLRASGALDCLTALLSPLMNAVGIPPEITPLMICFCRNRYRMITGKTVSIRPAITAP